MGRVPTLVALARRNVFTGSSRCRICDQAEEDVDHLFISYEVAQTLCDFISLWSRISDIYAFSVKDLFGWHKRVCGTMKWRKLVYSVMQVAAWVLWKWRNDLVFKQKVVCIARMKEEIKQFEFLWIKSRSSLKDCRCLQM
ncbi:hypothetical protein Hanom_Chr06g00551421 [Helianthus anomalus]